VLSIIVTWRDRAELAQALPGLVEAARLADGDLTIVNFGGDLHALRSQLQASPTRVVDVASQRYFHKARAQNVGAAHTHRPVLFFCDCDIVVDAEGVARLAAQVAGQDGVFATLAGVRESRRNARGGRHVTSFGYTLRLRTADGRELSIVDDEEDAATGARHAPGLLLVRRTDFLAIDGYNARLHGWGWEDQDMIARLSLGRGLRRLSEGYAVHLSHDDDARIAHYPPVRDRWESRDRMFRAALANYDAADFRGTYREDAALPGATDA
jgi:hypothetical protein